MKKMIAAILLITFALCLTACGGGADTGYKNDENAANTDENALISNPVQDSETEGTAILQGDIFTLDGDEMEMADHDFAPIAGGWSVNNGDLSLDAYPEIKAAFEKAINNNNQYIYQPLAYLGSQVVAGMNYRVFCLVTNTADKSCQYQIITIYADLNNNAEILSASELPGLPENGENLPGGWSVNYGDTSPEANPDAQAAFEKALDGLTGASYEPVAYLADQVVAGNNYIIFCRVTPVVPNPAPAFALVEIYADLNHNASVTDMTEIDFTGI